MSSLNDLRPHFPDLRAAPAAGRAYYGWVIVALSALAMVGTLPGRTQGLGLITEPLLRDLGLSRIAYAQINLVATLIGALGCAGVGRLIDRHGSRVVLTAVTVLLGCVTLTMSAAASIAAMAVLITLTRAFGQSALSVVSLAMIGKWFRRRLSTAMAVYSVTMSVGFMAAFPAVGAVVQASGWRVAWAAVGLALLFVLAPLAWFFDRSTPESVGLEVDGWAEAGGQSAAVAEQTAVASDSTLGEALRSPAFWVFAVASAMYGLVASGIGLFNESILAERGFPPDVYYRALAITAITGLAGNFIAGAAASRGSMRLVLVSAMLILAAALAALARVTTAAQVMAQAVAMGIGGGFVMVVFFSVWGRAFGRAHLGRIQGGAQAMTVLASAVGPLLLAWCVDATGSYASAFMATAGVVMLVAVAAAVVPFPPGLDNDDRRVYTQNPTYHRSQPR